MKLDERDVLELAELTFMGRTCTQPIWEAWTSITPISEAV
jgi:hypothetical protein